MILSFRPQIYDESETDQILNAKYFVWKNYTLGIWGLREAFNQNFLMQLFNEDRRIVQCLTASESLGRYLFGPSVQKMCWNVKIWLVFYNHPLWWRFVIRAIAWPDTGMSINSDGLSLIREWVLIKASCLCKKRNSKRLSWDLRLAILHRREHQDPFRCMSYRHCTISQFET